MAAGQDTALQINYKLPDGTLVNIYAKDQAHLETLLTSVSDLSTLITATATQLGANNTSAGRVANMTTQLGAQQVSEDKKCKHGDMTFMSGVSAKGPWKGYRCNAPKGEAKCETIWVR
jgi:hypothetical protein